MEKNTFRTACPRDCHDSCTVLATVENGRVVSVKGDPEHPITKGFTCPKVQSELERLYSPSRLLKPRLKRDGHWVEISWDAALDLLAEKLQSYREQWGPLSIMHYRDYGAMGWLNDMDERFFNLFGGATFTEGSLCAAAGSTAQKLDFGATYAHEPLDVLNAETIFIWGRNPAHTNIHLLPLLEECRKRGTYVVVIDPVPTRTIKYCDTHVAPRPGTDGALALGMAKVIIDEGLVDLRYVEEHVHGFQEFAQCAQEYHLERVAGITGVSAEIIRALAIRYATVKPGCILLGYGLQRYENSGNAIRAIDALGALTGNIGVAGGGVNYSCGFGGTLRRDLSARKKRKQYRAFPKPAVAKHILEATEPPIKALVVTRANPATQLPNTALVRQAFEAVEFKVVIDLEMTQTAEWADLVLPCTTFFEQENVFGAWGHHFITYGEQVIAPQGEAKSDWEIFSALADRLGFGQAYGSAADWLDTLLKPFLAEGQGREELRGQFFRCPGAPYVAWADGLFKTPSGKFELYSTKAVAMGLSPVATFQESAESTADAELAASYPFYLLTPAHAKSTHSQFYSQVEPGENVVVHMSSQVAALRGIVDGAMVKVETLRGSLVGRAQLNADYRADVVLIYGGGAVGAGKGVNLLTSDRLTDTGNSAAFYDCLCDVQVV